MSGEERGEGLAFVERSGASTVYTEDLSHGQEILGVSVTNPFRAIR